MLKRLSFTPGINKDLTNYAGEGGYYECDKVRFRFGLPQKIGGWQKYGTDLELDGICREMYNYITTNSDNIMCLGTNEKAYIEVGGNAENITPIRATITSPTTNNCFTTASGSTTVLVDIAGHGASDGSWVTFSGSTDVGGVPASELNAEHKITYIDANSFTIQVTTAATSTVSGGGGTSISAAFQLNIGNAITTLGYGWGAGIWSRGTWGSGSLTPVVLLQRDWWFDNFDNDAVMNIREGQIYYWTYTPLLTNRAVLLSSLPGASQVPVKVMQTLVSQNDKHLLAFGCVPYGSSSPADYDPLLIRWADQDDPTNWTPEVTNSAGFLRVSRGSRIIRALPTRQEILTFTDSHVYSLQFTGTTDVFALQELADNISIVSPRSCASVNNVTYWMGLDKFYMYSGTVETLPCTLRNHIFKDFNYDQRDQVVCGTNEGWHEVWWFYPSANATANDSYVIYNYLEKVWYYGTINRTAWIDSPLRQYPQAIGGYSMYDHESGTDDDTVAMNSYITTNDFDIEDGEELTLIKRIIPDVTFEGSTAANPQVLLTVKPRNFPGSSYSGANEPSVTRTATLPVEQYTEQVFLRARARQMGIKLQSSELGVQWQMGNMRLDGRPDGKR